jgi:hypothetical protein
MPRRSKVDPVQIIETVTAVITPVAVVPEKPEGLPPAELEPEAPLTPILLAEAKASRLRGASRSPATRAKKLIGGERERLASKAREKRRKKPA